jgi:hypothetical protein
MEVSGQLNPKARYPLDRRLGGPQSRFGQDRYRYIEKYGMELDFLAGLEQDMGLHG